MAIKQVSIFAENKPGTLVEITGALAAAKVDIRAMSLADTQDFGILRLIVSDADKAREALTSNGCVVSVTEVIAVAISDKPGALTEVVSLLSAEQINVEYMYAFITISKQYAYVVVRVQDNARAEEILGAAGVSLVSEEDIRQL